MDVHSSRFETALRQRIAEARSNHAAAVLSGMFGPDQYKRETGILQGFSEVEKMIEDIESDLNAEKGGRA